MPEVIADPNAPTASQASADPAAAASAAAASTAAASQDNEANKYRRLFEEADKKAKAQESELARLSAAEKQRQEAEMSEVQKATARAEAAEADAKRLKAESLRHKVAHETGVPAEAMEFLIGDDEDTLKAQAAKILKLAGTPVRAPLSGGTQTQPGSGQQASVQEQIATAEKAGNRNASLSLKLQNMRGDAAS